MKGGRGVIEQDISGITTIDAEGFPFSGGDTERGSREEQRSAKRLAVLRTGARMFNERGYDRTKIEDIAAELSVSKRTLYYYVKNKDDILLQVNKLAYESLEPVLDLCADITLPPIERIRTLLRAYVSLLSSDFGACLALNRLNLLAPESAAELRDKWLRLDLALRDLVTAGITDGSIAPCDPKFAAAALYGAFNWLPYWRSPDKTPSYEEIGEAFLQMFVFGLARKNET